MNKYLPIIGLEIHTELKTKTKMFCYCPNDSQEIHPNINICPVCVGHPGTLPIINREAIKKVIKTGLAFSCQINEESFFDRKNYFYPDLPKGYQISQYQKPLCLKGYLQIGEKKIRIRRIHLEEDTGKLVHGKRYSLVDFNRAGIPLMELVTEPDLNSAKEAKKFAEELQLILKYLEVSNADMEKGEMRIEANVSLTPLSQKSKMGTKVEIKNLNSFKAVERAIEYEIERQKSVLLSGKKIIQETRGWDDKREITIIQRKKEESHDYRYFPEPDLPPLSIGPEMVAEIKKDIPELPQEKRERFKKEYSLEEKTVEFFVKNKEFSEYFEKTVSELKNWIEEKREKINDRELGEIIKVCSNYFTTDFQGLLKAGSVKDEDFLVTPENFAEFITLIYQKRISSKVAKEVLKEMFASGADPSEIIEKKKLIFISDKLEIEKIIKKIILKNQKAISDFKKGKENAIHYLVGQVMKETKGCIDPLEAKKMLLKFLKDKKLNIN